MSIFDNCTIIGFGKILFTSKNHTVPDLPDMNLIILKNNIGHQAICIDLEIDSMGNTIEDACSNLKDRLFAYTTQMVDNCNDVKTAAEEITGIAYSQSEVKTQLFNLYKQAKYQYTLSRIKNKEKAVSRSKEFLNAINRLFQIEPIKLNLTLAAGIL